MKNITLSFIVMAAAAGFCGAQTPKSGGQAYGEKWPPLIEVGKFTEARSLCEGWLKAETGKAALAEAHKCMANVEMQGASRAGLRGDGRGGGSIGNSYAGPGVDKALGHLSAGIALAPRDMSIHEARLHIVIYSDKVAEAPAYLEKSIKAYAKKDGVEYWLNYAPELYDLGEYRVAVDFCKMLDKYYPDDHRVIANIGAFLSVLREDAQALPYTERAVKMNPKDEINVWNLARLYDGTGKTGLADKYYLLSMTLEQTPEDLREHQCIYSRFVEKTLKDRARACGLQEKNCAADARTACAPK